MPFLCSIYFFWYQIKIIFIWFNILNIKFAKEVTNDDKINLLTDLNNREVIVRVSRNGKILPVVKAKTTDFEAVPLKRDNVKEVHNNIKSNFSNFTARKLKDI